jgi:hypothetical protein
MAACSESVTTEVAVVVVPLITYVSSTVKRENVTAANRDKCKLANTKQKYICMFFFVRKR